MSTRNGHRPLDLVRLHRQKAHSFWCYHRNLFERLLIQNHQALLSGLEEGVIAFTTLGQLDALDVLRVHLGAAFFDLFGDFLLLCLFGLLIDQSLDILFWQFFLEQQISGSFFPCRRFLLAST